MNYAGRSVRNLEHPNETCARPGLTVALLLCQTQPNKNISRFCWCPIYQAPLEFSVFVRISNRARTMSDTIVFAAEKRWPIYFHVLPSAFFFGRRPCEEAHPTLRRPKRPMANNVRRPKVFNYSGHTIARCLILMQKQQQSRLQFL